VVEGDDLVGAGEGGRAVGHHQEGCLDLAPVDAGLLVGLGGVEVGVQVWAPGDQPGGVPGMQFAEHGGRVMHRLTPRPAVAVDLEGVGAAGTLVLPPLLTARPEKALSLRGVVGRKVPPAPAGGCLVDAVPAVLDHQQPATGAQQPHRPVKGGGEIGDVMQRQACHHDLVGSGVVEVLEPCLPEDRSFGRLVCIASTCWRSWPTGDHSRERPRRCS
jgi:hypothetical protein